MRQLLSILFPPKCVGCGWPGTVLCKRCGRFIYQPMIDSDLLSSVQEIVVAGAHDYPLNLMVHALKYQGQYSLARPAAKLTHQQFRTKLRPLPDVLTFSPMHRSKKKSRGYNQAELLSDELARLLKIPNVPLLEKTTNTTHQASLNRRQRQRNLRKAIALKPRYQRTLKTGLHIGFVDDVITTGATLLECIAAITPLEPKQLTAFAICYTPQKISLK